jgi:hypothetical protein
MNLNLFFAMLGGLLTGVPLLEGTALAVRVG